MARTEPVIADRAREKPRNPFKRVVRSVRKHGVVTTVKMAWGLMLHFLAHPVGNTRLYWAEVSQGGVVVCDIQGSRMRLDLSDKGISRELYLTGVHEPTSTRQFREELKPGMCLLEIGANIGYYVLIALQHVGSKGTVYALEPSPQNLASLCENLRLNGAGSKVKIYPYAAGREEATLPFYVMAKGNHSTFVKTDEDRFRRASVIDVQVSTIDALVKGENLKVDYFRMDVEGYEAEVIEGMVRTLTGPEPPAGAFIEVHPTLLREFGFSARSFVERMYELGYQVKAAYYDGGDRASVFSNAELYSHPLAEVLCWETFFVRRRDELAVEN